MSSFVVYFCDLCKLNSIDLIVLSYDNNIFQFEYQLSQSFLTIRIKESLKTIQIIETLYDSGHIIDTKCFLESMVKLAVDYIIKKTHQ